MKGVSAAILILIVAGLVIASSAFLIPKSPNNVNVPAYNHPTQENNSPQVAIPAEAPKENDRRSENNFKQCSGNGPVNFSVSPMNMDDVGVVIPMGLMVGGHVTPIDHMYFQPVDFSSLPDTYNVYASADGVIRSIGLEGKPVGDNKSIKNYNKYRLVIYHTCDFYSIYNLVTSLSDKIISVSGTIEAGSTKSFNIPVKAGEVLGKIGGQTLDLSVNYDAITLKGFIVPNHYDTEPWKIHTVDPTDYFTEPIRSQILAKDLREALPRGGKIDYDIDGRLVGNWFVENTNGYRGNNPSAYWSTQLSIVYNHIDPSRVMVSIGDFKGEARQFAVKGNSPDPKDVSILAGPVKYELVDFDYVDKSGQSWNRFAYSSGIRTVERNNMAGTILVQLISDRKLKVEVFPGKSSNEVTGFDNNAVMYER